MLAEADDETREDILDDASEPALVGAIAEMPPDDAADVVAVLPPARRDRLLTKIPRRLAAEVRHLLRYGKETAGGTMTSHVAVVTEDLTAAEAVRKIRREMEGEEFYQLFVTDHEGRLVGQVPLYRLLLAPGDCPVRQIMERDLHSVPLDADQEEAVKLFERYDLYALPVVDQNNILLGIVTADDIFDVIEEEVTEDIQKVGGVTPLEMSYVAASPFTLYKKRVFWLSFLAVSGFLTSTVIAYFQNTLSAVIALAFFIPVLIGTGGNTSNQVSALVIRALATGELTLNRWFEVVKKELVVGFLLGITIGILLSLWGYWKGGPQIGPVVGVSVILIVIWSNLVGGLLPIILTRIGLDPAFISSPLLSTLLDITGLLIYFMVANVMLLK